MNPEEYTIMYQVEDHHWWYRGMARITRAVLGRWYRPGSGLRILDAGCGTGGAMASYLRDYGEVTGFDFAGEALSFCRLRGATRLTRASVVEVPFADESFDLVVSFDVLCERAVRSDPDALREFYRVLVPGGRVLLRLPAYNWLRGRHDVAVHIRHRYTCGEIARQLREAGFQVELLSYANMFLFPGALVKRMAERLLSRQKGPSDLAVNVGPLNGVLTAVLSAEAPLVARGLLPFGLTVVAAGRKPQG
ncbi:MAG: class I SAM-dependent methyltransferase [Thermoflexales bacterium]|nr:class I SAM-dependent methyltransferase [Thermoflexales bacterium]